MAKKTADQLRAAIEKLEQELLALREEKHKTTAPPLPKQDPDFRPLVAMLAEIVKERAAAERCEEDDSDDAVNVFEKAMEIVYGRDIWDWWNSK